MTSNIYQPSKLGTALVGPRQARHVHTGQQKALLQARARSLVARLRCEAKVDSDDFNWHGSELSFTYLIFPSASLGGCRQDLENSFPVSQI
jgi:hypothetical protein